MISSTQQSLPRLTFNGSATRAAWDDMLDHLIPPARYSSVDSPLTGTLFLPQSSTSMDQITDLNAGRHLIDVAHEYGLDVALHTEDRTEIWLAGSERDDTGEWSACLLYRNGVHVVPFDRTHSAAYMANLRRTMDMLSRWSFDLLRPASEPVTCEAPASPARTIFASLRAYTYAEFGPRCDDFEPHCPTCKAWHEFDTLHDSSPDTPVSPTKKGSTP